MVQRALTEARAGRYTPDVLETNGPEMEILYRERLLERFYSPAFKDLPAAAFPAHRHWVADRFNFFVIGYNTNLVKPEDVPNSYADLLKPRWAGKVGLEAGDVDWFGAMVKGMGEKEGLAYFRKLAELRPQIRTGHTLIAELVASGEIPLAASVYNHDIERLTVKGAPVRWKVAGPDVRPAERNRACEECATSACRAAVRRFHALARGAATAQGAQPGALQQCGGQPAQQVQVSDDRSGDRAGRRNKWERLWSDLFLKGRAVRKEAE